MLARLAAIGELPEAGEGVSLMPVLADLQNRGPASAIYRGGYKLIHRDEGAADLGK